MNLQRIKWIYYVSAKKIVDQAQFTKMIVNSLLMILLSCMDHVAGYADTSQNERFIIFPIYHSVCSLFCEKGCYHITLHFISKLNSRYPRFKVGSREVVRVWSANKCIFWGTQSLEPLKPTRDLHSFLFTQRKLVILNAEILIKYINPQTDFIFINDSRTEIW